MFSINQYIVDVSGHMLLNAFRRECVCTRWAFQMIFHEVENYWADVTNLSCNFCASSMGTCHWISETTFAAAWQHCSNRENEIPRKLIWRGHEVSHPGDVCMRTKYAIIGFDHGLSPEPLMTLIKPEWETIHYFQENVFEMSPAKYSGRFIQCLIK